MVRKKKMKRSQQALLAAALLVTVAQTARSEDAAPSLPGGASSLQETYQDWRLACQNAQPKPLCSVSQEQAQQNGQRVLAVELVAAGKDTLTGNLILPFGLMLDAGVALQVDDGQAGKPLRFSTCVPGGCIVPLKFDAAYVAKLRAGTSLHLKSKSMDGKDVALAVSLKGLPGALDRLQALGGS
jgi:invasion protein IalB